MSKPDTKKLTFAEISAPPRAERYAILKETVVKTFGTVADAKNPAASEGRISLTPGASGFELQVADNGKGFACGAINAPPVGQHSPCAIAGNGLANMRSRLQEIGGDCELQSEPGAGTKTTFRVTLKADHGQR